MSTSAQPDALPGSSALIGMVPNAIAQKSCSSCKSCKSCETSTKKITLAASAADCRHTVAALVLQLPPWCRAVRRPDSIYQQQTGSQHTLAAGNERRCADRQSTRAREGDADIRQPLRTDP